MAPLLSPIKNQTSPRKVVPASPMMTDSSSQPSPKMIRLEEEGVAVLQIAKLSDQATVPTRGSARAAGYDLYSAEVVNI